MNYSPLNLLPRELLFKIIDTAYDDDPSSLNAIGLVCKDFWSASTFSRYRYVTIDLEADSLDQLFHPCGEKGFVHDWMGLPEADYRDISEEDIKKAIHIFFERSEVTRSLRHLTITSMLPGDFKFTDDVVALIGRLSNLETITWQCTSNLPQDIVDVLERNHPKASLRILYHVCDSRLNHRHEEPPPEISIDVFRTSPNLTHLRGYFTDSNTVKRPHRKTLSRWRRFCDTISHAPNLQHIDIIMRLEDDTKDDEKPKPFKIENVRQTRSVKTLRITGIFFDADWLFDEIGGLIDLSQLESLTIGSETDSSWIVENQWPSDRFLMEVADRLPNLKHFSFPRSLNIENEWKVVQNHSEKDEPFVRDEWQPFLKNFLSRLESLNIANWPYYKSLKPILTHTNQLKRLHIHQYSDYSEKDGFYAADPHLQNDQRVYANSMTDLNRIRTIMKSCPDIEDISVDICRGSKVSKRRREDLYEEIAKFRSLKRVVINYCLYPGQRHNGDYRSWSNYATVMDEDLHDKFAGHCRHVFETITNGGRHPLTLWAVLGDLPSMHGRWERLQKKNVCIPFEEQYPSSKCRLFVLERDGPIVDVEHPDRPMKIKVTIAATSRVEASNERNTSHYIHGWNTWDMDGPIDLDFGFDR